MKILAIRGKNLASLAGEFEVDFEVAPLRDAGVFAIVGPTGAGKSTILDTVCLALFDRTPRLAERGGTLVGAQTSSEASRLRAQDVRSVLRKGTAAGYAEVDFLGSDRQRYRARWSVKRARDRADGAFRPQTMELRNLTTRDAIGSTKTEVLKAIEQRLGLSFDQFRRSALLAQGEFAAFLRADERDRASLLEQITGSDIYTRVSIAAFRRSAGEAAQVAQLEASLVDLPVLDTLERETKDAQRATLESETAATAERVLALDQAAAWYEAQRLLTKDLHEARAQAAALSDTWESKAEDREYLAVAERLRAALGPIAAADLARTERDLATERLAMAVALEGDRTTDEDVAREAVSRSLSALSEDRATRAAWRDEIESARALDTLVASSAALLESARSRARESRDRAEAAERALTSATERHAAARTALEAIWVAASRSLEAARARSEIDEAALSRSASVLLAAEAAGRGDNRAALRGGRERLAALSLDLGALEAATVELERARAAAAEGRARALSAGQVAVESARIAEASSSEGQEHAARMAEAQRSLDVARAALSLAGQRAELRSGDECPLCGSKEHPWAVSAPDLSPLLLQLTRRVSALSVARSDVLRVELAERLRHGEATKQVEAAGAQVVREDGAVAVAARRCKELEVKLGLGPASAAEDGETLSAAVAKLREAEATLRAEEERAERADDAASSARLAHRAALEDAARSKRLVEAASRDVDGAAVALAAADVATDRARLALRAAEEELAPALHGVTDWTDALVLATHTLESSTRELDATRAVLSSAAPAADQDARSLASLDLAGAELRARRARLLRGTETSLFVGELERVAESILGLDAAARTRHESARLAKAEASAKRESAALDSAARDRACDDAERLRDVALAGAHTDLASARAILARGTDWLERGLADRDALSRRLYRARTIAEERRAKLAGHEARGHSTASDADVGGQRASAADALRGLQERLFAVRHQLTRDDESRAARAGREAALRDQAGKARIWKAMADLIGASDGKRFRVFAQSLTFEALLEQSNVHMREISPRYSLLRVPGSDLELQVVDHDMADEVRAAASLSGGEAFLVSLSLALGLSSLGSHRASVETVFIDEGFGTLDAEALEMALASLEALHASVRQIGIISHVTGLADRLSARVTVERRGPGRSRVVVATS